MTGSSRLQVAPTLSASCGRGQEQLEMLIPETLDDIVRRNRHLCTIRLSTSQEVAVLDKNIIVPDGLVPKDEFVDWRVICLDRAAQLGGPIHVLLGYARLRINLMTSPVVAIGNGHAITESGSLYRLSSERGEGEPSVDQLVLLCAGLNSWGWGPALGVPAFFF